MSESVSADSPSRAGYRIFFLDRSALGVAIVGMTGYAIGRIRGRRFVFDSDALDKLDGSAWFSSSKIETMLGFRPKWNLEEALPEMIQEMEKIR